MPWYFIAFGLALVLCYEVATSRLFKIVEFACIQCRADLKSENVGAAGFKHVRVHDLKHAFGRRLRAAGVSFEDRQDLLGHKSGRITTHYSQAELTNLIEAADKVHN